MDPSSVVDLTWRIACTETIGSKVQFIEPEHFLAAMTKLGEVISDEEIRVDNGRGVDSIRQEVDLVSDVLRNTGIDPKGLRHEIRKCLNRGNYEHGQGETVHRSERTRRVFRYAEDVAERCGARQLAVGHLFLAILEESDSVGSRLLVEKGARLKDLAESTRKRLSVTKKEEKHQRTKRKEGISVLDRYGRDLTREAHEGRLGPIIGRRREILDVIQTLARHSKNNPVLVGEAGVGKTAIVEAVAVRAAMGKNPHVLAGKRIIELNMSTLVGGTSNRGDFEERLSKLIDECREQPEVILFIDEIHTIIGAGGSEGRMDAANILKPALARGEVRCIGATTVAEYRRDIESDPALERRFDKIVVGEPSRDEAIEILRGLQPKWEEHHQAKITERAIEAAVDLSVRFDRDHQLPDKAIDLLDKAGARTKVPVLSFKQDVSAPGNRHINPIATVTEMTVAKLISEKTGLPIELIMGHLDGTGQSRLLEMETYLKKRVIGQDDAVERVCQRLLMTHAALRQKRGTLGVFLFLGPTGVGKTELARSIALFLFGSDKQLIRLGMSEYMQEHSVAKLIGSPPGYIGYKEEGQLTGKMRSYPYSVVLLDEAEKAHPRVFDLFLQVFDEGRLTDSKGRTADARNAIFIMTSNIGADKPMGFRHNDEDELGEPIPQEVKKRFRAELINRVDETIVFCHLARDKVKVILEQMIEDIRKAFETRYGKSIRFTDEAIELLACKGFSEEYGVRHLQRTVERMIEAPLSCLVLSGEVVQWPGVEVRVRNNEIVIDEHRC